MLTNGSVLIQWGQERGPKRKQGQDRPRGGLFEAPAAARGDVPNALSTEATSKRVQSPPGEMREFVGRKKSLIAVGRAGPGGRVQQGGFGPELLVERQLHAVRMRGRVPGYQLQGLPPEPTCTRTSRTGILPASPPASAPLRQRWPWRRPRGMRGVHRLTLGDAGHCDRHDDCRGPSV